MKRRKVEDAVAVAERQREHLLRNHIKRNGALMGDVVTKSLLEREVGGGRGEAGWLGAVPESDEIAAAAWAEGLEGKGEVSFAPSFARRRARNMSLFYVGGEDMKTGLGVAYACEYGISLAWTSVD